MIPVPFLTIPPESPVPFSSLGTRTFVSGDMIRLARSCKPRSSTLSCGKEALRSKLVTKKNRYVCVSF